MSITFIIQARTGSTRFPRKILRPFYHNKCILELLVEKLKCINNTNIIVATPDTKDNDIIEAFCNNINITCFRGDENDVLKRFIDAAEKYNANKIIRICSDNPFLELASIKLLVDKARKSDSDYISFNINNTPSIKTHYGFWAEFTTLSTLKKISKLTSEHLFHEHVTNYIYTHPDSFSIEWIQAPSYLNENNNIRLTIDTEEDFKNAQYVYENICENNPYPTIAEIVNYINLHPEIYNNMIKQIKINSK